MREFYLGMTIGPILDTLDLATYPAALSYASSMFSYLAGRLCGLLRTRLKARIISPYYAETPRERHQDENGFFTEGAGLFHDRIICRVGSESGAQSEKDLQTLIEQCIEAAKADMRRNIYLQTDENGAEGYLNIHYILVPAERVKGNCILALSDYLDGMELTPTFRPQAQDEPLLSIFRREENEKIQNSPMMQAVIPNVLVKGNGRLRSIEDICNSSRFKNYFAVVQADGDSMGTVLAKRVTDEGVTEFSRNCLEYAAEAAAKVRGFGGMPVYAGGDDLLFLAPVINKDGMSVFELCKKLSDIYKERMNGGEHSAHQDGISEIEPLKTAAVKGTEPEMNVLRVPGQEAKTSLSFGIAIQYYKFPLYEALERARGLLFSEAKDFSVETNGDGGKDSKNCMAIRVEKHSGQSIGMRVRMDDTDAFRQAVLDNKNTEEEESFLSSVPYHLSGCHAFFRFMDERSNPPEKQYLEFLRNFLSLSETDAQDSYLSRVAAYYEKEIVTGHCQSLKQTGDGQWTSPETDTGEENSYEPLNTLIGVLRLKKFLSEGGGEER